MSEEKLELKQKVVAAICQVEANENIHAVSRLVVDEKISSLLAIDEDMVDAMLTYARDNEITPEAARLQWEQTTWHKIIKARTDKLRELRKELEL